MAGWMIRVISNGAGATWKMIQTLYLARILCADDQVFLAWSCHTSFEWLRISFICWPYWECLQISIRCLCSSRVTLVLSKYLQVMFDVFNVFVYEIQISVNHPSFTSACDVANINIRIESSHLYVICFVHSVNVCKQQHWAFIARHGVITITKILITITIRRIQIWIVSKI